MSNVVFILGAGASKQSGAPLMGNFLDVATDLLRSNSVTDKRAEFETVFAAIGGLQAVHSKAKLDLNNIESIFTALELGRILRHVPGMNPESIDDAIKALKDLIVRTLEITIRFPCSQGYITAPPPYDSFAEMVKGLREKAQPQQSVSIITFNYDIGVDVGLHRAGLGPNYVLEPAPQSQDAVDLLKLHGSLNWATETDTKKIRPLHLHHYFQKYSVRSPTDPSGIGIPIGSQLAEFFSSHAEPKVAVNAEPVIVPPSWNKADYHQALSDVWAAAARHLSEAESVFVAGYSLPETDSFFRHLFALGSVGKAAFRRVVVYNPDPKVDARFRQLLGPGALARYTFQHSDFEYAIDHMGEQFCKR